MAIEHQSFFRYKETRPYPFKWFSPVVITVFMIATALFSFLNFITTGYSLVSEVSTNPNSTSTQQRWIQNLPSYLSSRLKSACQPALLNIHDVVLTNNSALTYTIESLSMSENGQILPSVEYASNVLTNCSIANVDMDLSGFDRPMNQLSFSRWSPLIRTFIQCTVNGSRGQILVNMTNEYNYEPSNISLGRLYTFLGSGFLTRNQTARPALWWGESLMSWYWSQVSIQLQSAQDADDAPYNIRKGFLSFSRNYTTSDVKSLDYFILNQRFLDDDDPKRLLATGYINVAQFDSAKFYPNIWIPADTLAKSVYWTILTDLGQSQKTSNILTSQQLLSHFTSNFSLIGPEGSIYNAQPGPSKIVFEPYQTTSGDTVNSFEPSIINTSYLCQVPRIKSVGNLLLSIIVADLVFIQALWTVLVFVVDTFFLKEQSGITSTVSETSESDYREPPYKSSHIKSPEEYSLRVLPFIVRKNTAVAEQGFGGQGARRPGYRPQSSSQQNLLDGSS